MATPDPDAAPLLAEYRRVVDEAAVRDLAARYCWAIDTLDREAFGRVFTPDATALLGNSNHDGIDDIWSKVDTTLSPLTCSQHLIGSQVVDLGPDGNVRSLKTWTQNGDSMRQFAGTIMFAGLGGGYAAGTYRAEWDGSGVVTFGADAVVDAAGVVWVVEVNPRPCASMELIERATGESIAAAHLAACGAGPAPTPTASAGPPRWAKAVLYAPHAITIDAAWLARVAAWQGLWSAAGHAAIADIPAAGRTIPAAAPVCTLFAAADTAAAAADQLHARATAVSASISRPGGAAWPPAGTRSSIP